MRSCESRVRWTTVEAFETKDGGLGQDPSQRGRFKKRKPVADGVALQQVADLFAATPPMAIEAEQSLIGSVLWDPKVLGDVLQIVRSGADFSQPRHARVYDAMIELYDKTASVDAVTLQNLLRDRGILEEVGGMEYVVSLAEAVASPVHAPHYARIIREKATVRELIEAAGEILAEAHQSHDPAQQVLERAEQRIFRIAQRREGASFASMRDLIDETMRIIEASDGKGFMGVRTGFAAIDEVTNGLQNGELIILAARPSMGKTAMALNLIENIALLGVPSALFSLEMSRQQLVQRMLSSRGGIDGQKMRRHMLGGDDHRRLMSACDDLSKAPIFIDDSPGLSLLGMRSKARRMKEKFGIGFIAIDYLQLMSSGTRVESRQIEVSEISRGIKAMARELEIPVLCLSQLNRAAEQREGHRPRMSDLRESGSIEQDADVVAMLHRESYYHKQDQDWLDANPEKENAAEFIICKQRNGPTGTVHLVWDGDTTRFKTMAYSSVEGSGASRYSG